MKITTMTVRVASNRRFKDGSKSIHDLALTAELSDGDDPNEVWNELYIRARRLVTIGENTEHFSFMDPKRYLKWAKESALASQADQ